MIETIEVDKNGHCNEEGSYMMPGLQGISGSEVKVAFMNPAGSMTSQLFPTGNPCDYVTVSATEARGEPLSIRATLLDVANPFILVDASTLPTDFQDPNCDDPSYLPLVESIRREGAVSMGLADSIASAAQVRGTPKIAFLWPPASSDGKADIMVRAFSMGKPHPSLQLTGAVCLGAGVCLPGTVPYRLADQTTGGQVLPTPERTPSPSGKANGESVTEDVVGKELEVQTLSYDVAQAVRIEHASGLMEVEVVTRHFSGDRGVVDVERCVVSRTARRLFEGNVYFYL